MKDRQIYYRKKEGKTIIEGKENTKTIFILTLPEPETLLNELIEKSSFFTQEKGLKILEKIKRLDFKPNKAQKQSDKVRLPNITRTLEKDESKEENDITEEQSAELWEITK